MNSKLLGALLPGIGLLVVGVGVLLSAVIVPDLKQFPADVDVTRTFELRYLTLLDADTLQIQRYTPDSADLTISRHIRVEEEADGVILLRESQTVAHGDEALVEQMYHYALNRRDLLPAVDYPAAWDALDGLWPREGLTIGWPVGVDQRNYQGWNEDTRATVSLNFNGQRVVGLAPADRALVDLFDPPEMADDHSPEDTLMVYVFSSDSAPERLDDAHVAFLGLPDGLPVMRLATLAAGLDLPDVDLPLAAQLKLVGAITQAVNEVVGAGADVPLEYYYDYVALYHIEPTTGVLVDTHKYEHRAATFPPDVYERVVEILAEMEQDADAADYLPPDILDVVMPITVNEFYYVMAQESVEDAAEDARTNRDSINLLENTLPLFSLIGGVVLAMIGGTMYAREEEGNL
ncbi:MAG: DUF3068 domain-containing protein [Anaerolineaceae bacterium]|nr:MAG: DUF3068 domain-containing protein [Anaerolineaceae bacterium]